MMPILVKIDDVNWKKGQGLSQAVMGGTRVNELRVKEIALFKVFLAA